MIFYSPVGNKQNFYALAERFFARISLNSATFMLLLCCFFSVTLLQAHTEPTLPSSVTKNEKDTNKPDNSMVCNNLLQVSLANGTPNCIQEINPDQCLEGTYPNPADFMVTLTYPTGTNVLSPSNQLDASHIGHTIQFMVTNTVTGNTCWGQLNVEDKMPPTLVCPANTTVLCAADISPAVVGNPVVSDCSAYSLNHADIYTAIGACATPVTGSTARTWTATDAYGNKGVCTQTISYAPFDLVDVVFPADVTVSCADVSADPSLTTAAVTGYPTVAGQALSNSQSLCMASVSVDERSYTICPGTYEIIRTWRVRNMCLPLSDPNYERVDEQLIKVVDNVAPAFTCPNNVTIEAINYNCTGNFTLPNIAIADACSGIKTAFLNTPFGANTNLTVTNGAVGGVVFNNIPLGTYNFQLFGRDMCENEASCSFTVTAEDTAPPVAVCDEHTVVSLGFNGIGRLNASSLDDGSYDHCKPVNFKVRRMASNTCDPSTSFDDYADFCCADEGATTIVVLRVYDVAMPTGPVSLTAQQIHSNECMVEVQVQDKLRPTCIAPANVTVDCKSFDPTLWTYGMATGVDNCTMDTVTMTTSYAAFDTMCNRGVINRTFTARDHSGLTATCTQRIQVDYIQDYFVKFPNDVTVSQCDGTGNYGEPIIYDEDCELVGMSFTDEIITLVPDACYKIERTWRVSNWCTYDTNLGSVYVPNPSNTTAGPRVSPHAPGTHPWDATSAAYQALYSSTANSYTYKQIIKIVDNEAPVVVSSNIPDSCDYTANNSMLWNNATWFDATHGTHDLCEAAAPLTFTATDSCSGTSVNMHYLLYLDLDGDGTMETVVNSLNPPPAGQVAFNNAGNVNFTGGTLRNFDQRPVAATDLYRFGIKTTNAGNITTSEVVWKTAANFYDPTAGVAAELPYGAHKVKWFVSDRCGNDANLERSFSLKDCKKPTVVCKNGISVNLMNVNPAMVSIGLSSILEYSEDGNCTPSDQLVFGMCLDNANAMAEDTCHTNALPLFPNGTPDTLVTFNCAMVGMTTVQVWSQDKAGNLGYCAASVSVQDNMSVCGNSTSATIAGALEAGLSNGTMEGVEGSMVQLSGSHPTLPPLTEQDYSDVTGRYDFNALPIDGSYIVSPSKDDDHLNGVNTYDLLLIQKHLLGAQPLTSPYKMIAADVNKSGSITPTDIIELRKLILGIYQDGLPANESWRFVDRSYVFNNPQNPFAEAIPEQISITQLQQAMTDGMFEAIKIGDLNEDATANATQKSDDRTTAVSFVELADRTVEAGETYTIHIQTAPNTDVYQFTLNHTGLELLDIEGENGLNTQHFAVFADKNAVTVASDVEKGAFTATFKANKAGRLSDFVQLSSAITEAIAYDAAGQKMNLALRFDGTTKETGIGFELYPNTPNPFTAQTNIGFNLPEAMTATLNVYNENGQLMHTQAGDFAKGKNTFQVLSQDLQTSGFYYYEIVTPQAKLTGKMIKSTK